MQMNGRGLTQISPCESTRFLCELPRDAHTMPIGVVHSKTARGAPAPNVSPGAICVDPRPFNPRPSASRLLARTIEGQKGRTARRVCVAAVTWLVGACSSDKPTAPSADITDPARAVFVTSDIEHFWKAYDDGGASGNNSAFQTEYLDRASSGLKDFIAARNLTA